MDQKSTWLIKICCVIAAFSLWLYINNVDNNQVNQRITVPVEVTGQDFAAEKGYKVLPGQQFSIVLNVKGSPADIALGKSEFRVEANLTNLGLFKGEVLVPIKIIRQPVNVTVVNSAGLYVKVMIDDLVEKTLPIKLSYEGKVKDGYFALQQSTKPTDAVISGAAKYVNQVVGIEAKVDLKNSDKDLNLSLPLKAVDATGRELKEVEIKPSIVEITVPIKKTKTVGINVISKGKVVNGFYFNGFEKTPDKVDIAGGDIINSITALDTEPIDLSTLTPNKVIVAKLILPSGVTLVGGDGTVKLKANVDKDISQNFSLDIAIRNLNDAYTATLDNSKVTLIVTGPESTVTVLKNENFNCYIDLNSITTEGDHTVPVNLTIPERVLKTSQNPVSVKVTLKKKAVQPTTTTPTNGGQQ